MKKLVTRLYLEMKQRDLTYEMVAKRSNVTPATVRACALYLSTPSIVTAMRIAKAIGWFEDTYTLFEPVEIDTEGDEVKAGAQDE